MRVLSGLELWRERPINRYLLCSVLAQQARRLGRLIPEMRVSELIGVAWQNCTEHRVKVLIDGNTPKVIREEAAQMFPLAELSTSPLAVGAVTLQESQTANEFSSIEWHTGQKDGQGEEGASPPRIGADNHVSMGASVDSFDRGGTLPSIQRKYSMTHTNGTDKMRQFQLRALAENLYTLAKRHRENGNYVVAHALYGRALEMARGVDTLLQKENGSVLVERIQKDQQEVFEMLRSGDVEALVARQEKAQKAGS